MAEESKADEAKKEETPAPAGNNKNNGRNKKDETPIEELYDLSKPIPKVGCGTESTQLVRVCFTRSIVTFGFWEGPCD